jgi:hypothetical protein
LLSHQPSRVENPAVIFGRERLEVIGRRDGGEAVEVRINAGRDGPFENVFGGWQPPPLVMGD